MTNEPRIEKKRCPDCGLQPVTEFNNDKNRIDGKQTYCRTCQNLRNRESWAKKKAMVSHD